MLREDQEPGVIIHLTALRARLQILFRKLLDLGVDLFLNRDARRTGLDLLISLPRLELQRGWRMGTGAGEENGQTMWFSASS